ncbi:hypothetical protein [Arabidopsis thaliana]|jgi:hypothetical protein|uniref:Transmembrane protein n=2 Tax=Arabidopsis thaliana TaxID=3702 RepID=Q9SMN5_ARATH|nr:uncharacterized protein AT3G48640 [Arabidopsis thaliana]NP_001325918.1 uncharacterized protein AT3G48640 [Arabidopsis thaliana]NP_190433.1 uncharacterized protein AT3G48640 [Arabidopsis thaliana]AEE78440.1 transmembrane protein [Arabidopsis thaliana]ANM63849.1 transmembrane protein [Arabidopsis thaliana]ANM63850.1 transmembrane protein [Arabidopsis thaliana]CAB62353.1 hypothetical protein [Arabidopsis thaliana]|eukprot:NP_001319710.1 transmembrane protein [Arabidopsis thaliana]
MPSVQEVYKILADLKVLNQDVANTITTNGLHVSWNEGLKSIANLYLENTTKTLNLFEKFMYTEEVVTQYVCQVNVYWDHVTTNWDHVTTKTRKLSEKFMYTDEFATQYESVYRDHVMLLGKIRELEVVLEKKYKHAKRKRIMKFGFGAVIFIPCFVVAVVGQLNPAFGMAGQGGERGVEVAKKLYKLTMEEDNSMETTLLGLSRLIGNTTKGNIEAMEKIKSHS